MAQRNLLKCAFLISIIGMSLAQDPRPLLVVPNIQTDYYDVMSTGNQYRLRITHPDGSQREELVELRASGTPKNELFIQGTIENLYPDNGARLVVVYEAGKNGYVAKVKYDRRPMLPAPTIPPVGAPIGGLGISGNALKSSVG